MLIDRERFKLLRLVRRDFETRSFASDRDVMRYHLNPDQAFTPDLESLALQLQEAHTEISSWRAALAASHTLLAQVPAVLTELLGEVRQLRREVSDLHREQAARERSEDRQGTSAR